MRQQPADVRFGREFVRIPAVAKRIVRRVHSGEMLQPGHPGGMKHGFEIDAGRGFEQQVRRQSGERSAI